MIDWLCDTFGFERYLVVEGKNNSIHHAQLTIGQGMIMLSSARDDEFGQFQEAGRLIPSLKSTFMDEIFDIKLPKNKILSAGEYLHCTGSGK